MNRKTLDSIASYIGLAIAAVLVVAGGLLNWGYSFANTTVTDQLSAQEIYFPEETAGVFDAETAPTLFQWAGMQVTTGEQAKGYSEDYIAHHMAGAVEGWNAANPDYQVGATYSQVSGTFMGLSKDPNADPTVLAGLGQLRQTMFMGNALRGLLLEAYAFWMFGQIAFYASIACFVGAALFLVLALLGFRHAKAAASPAAATKNFIPIR